MMHQAFIALPERACLQSSTRAQTQDFSYLDFAAPMAAGPAFHRAASASQKPAAAVEAEWNH
jgi:hypothetical protein